MVFHHAIAILTKMHIHTHVYTHARTHICTGIVNRHTLTHTEAHNIHSYTHEREEERDRERAKTNCNKGVSVIPSLGRQMWEHFQNFEAIPVYIMNSRPARATLVRSCLKKVCVEGDNLQEYVLIKRIHRSESM